MLGGKVITGVVLRRRRLFPPGLLPIRDGVPNGVAFTGVARVGEFELEVVLSGDVDFQVGAFVFRLPYSLLGGGICAAPSGHSVRLAFATAPVV